MTSHRRPARKVLTALAVGMALGGCGDAPQTAAPGTKAGRPSPEPAEATPGRQRWPAPSRYEPDAAETYRNGKRLASRVVLEALTYPKGASASQVAARLSNSASARRELSAALAPAVEPRTASRAEIVYPQLSGVTPTSLGAMVLVKQRLQDARGTVRAVTRVVDVQLRRSDGPWRVDRIASVGGRAVARPAGLSVAAREVVDHPRITLSDSARWDIYEGRVDEALLRALARLAGRHRFSVGVLRSGHPPNVWATSRISAHTRGAAADIYAVGGRLVLRQRVPDSPAYDLARWLVDRGAAQVGSPWQFAPAGRRSFTDAVHQDHVHVQWSTTL